MSKTDKKKNLNAGQNSNQSENIIRLVEGTTPLLGKEFFSSFIEHLVHAYGAQFGIANELICHDPITVRTHAFWQNGELGENFEYAVKTTPCEVVYDKGFQYFPSDIQAIFAEDKDLVEMCVHSYLGIPLTTQDDEIIGHICILGADPLAEHEHAEEYFKIFAARASAELQRIKLENELIQHREHLKQLVDEQTSSLQKSKEELEQANQAKSKFLDRMSHELYTPMNAILGYSELLIEDHDCLSEEQGEYINSVIKAGWHLNTLINEILDFSLFESGEAVTNLSQCRLKDIISTCIPLISSQAAKKQIKVIYDEAASTGASVIADKTRLKQIIINLLSNAVKFNNNNGNITINIDPLNEKQVRISISDTGPGITKQDQHKVFEQFERLESDDKCIDGSGIGLAITKRLVEHMGGAIGLESEPGKGSTFWIEFDAVD